MDELKLGDKVVIKESKVIGQIIGIWHSLYGQTQYNVRYYDTAAHKADGWFVEDEIKIV